MQTINPFFKNVSQWFAGLETRIDAAFYRALKNRWNHSETAKMMGLLVMLFLMLFFGSVIFILAVIGYNMNFNLAEAGITKFRTDWVLPGLVPVPLPLLKFFIMPAVAFVLAVFVAGRFVQDVYDLETVRQGVDHIISSIIGSSWHYLEVDEGEIKLTKGEKNPLLTVGGPGLVVIRPGNVVQFRQLREMTNSSTALRYHLSAFERIELPVSLEDQVGHAEAAKMETLDGIRVAFKDIRYGYRIQPAKPGFKRSPGQPYSYSNKALEMYVFDRAVDANEYRSWKRNISFAIDGPIMNFVNNNRIDHVMAPGIDEVKVRDELRKHTMKQQPLTRSGAELLWIDIGSIVAETFDEEINSQRLERWAVDWKGDAEVMRAYGEANRRVLMERARANAQAEIITSIANSFELVEWKDDDEVTNLRRILLSRTAQLIERMLEKSIKPDGDG